MTSVGHPRARTPPKRSRRSRLILPTAFALIATSAIATTPEFDPEGPFRQGEGFGPPATCATLPDWIDRVPDYDGRISMTVTGRIVNVGRLAGARAEFDFDLHALRRIRYIGVTFRTRSDDEVGAIISAVERDLGPALSEGKLRLPIDRVLPLFRAQEALDEMKANRHFGKIVLDCS